MHFIWHRKGVVLKASKLFVSLSACVALYTHCSHPFAVTAG